jgi:hypothetical protein
MILGRPIRATARPGADQAGSGQESLVGHGVPRSSAYVASTV